VTQSEAASSRCVSYAFAAPSFAISGTPFPHPLPREDQARPACAGEFRRRNGGDVQMLGWLPSVACRLFIAPEAKDADPSASRTSPGVSRCQIGRATRPDGMRQWRMSSADGKSRVVSMRGLIAVASATLRLGVDGASEHLPAIRRETRQAEPFSRGAMVRENGVPCWRRREPRSAYVHKPGPRRFTLSFKPLVLRHGTGSRVLPKQRLLEKSSASDP